MIKRLKVGIPWYAKISAKLILARIPLPYKLWKSLGVFGHGPMQQSDYAQRVFKSHYAARALRPGFCCLELGPGDSLLSALFARAQGAGRIYLVDVGRFATDNCEPYRELALELKSQGCDVPTEFNSVPEMLEQCNAHYLTAGLASLAEIPTGSVDFIWSQAVLEHVRLEQFSSMVGEWRRIMKDDGFASHSVDLKDHFNNALNNLRFSDERWESTLFKTSGFYTNRLRCGEMLGLFRAQGFSTTITREVRWDKLPTDKAQLAPRFRGMTDDELLVSSFTVMLRPENYGIQFSNGKDG